MIKIDAYDLATYVAAQRGGPLLTILDEVRDFVFIKDTDSRFLYSNRAHLSHIGRTEKEVLGKDDFDLFPHHLAEAFFAAETALFESRIPVVRLQESVDKHGQKFFSTAIKMLITDKHDNALGLIGTVHRIAPQDDADLARCRRHIMEILREQPGVTPSQLMAFEATMPTLPSLAGKR